MRMQNIVLNDASLMAYFNRLVKVVCLAAVILQVVLKKTFAQVKEIMESHDRSLKVWLLAYWKRKFDRNIK